MKRRSRKLRRGIAATEFAVVLPFFVILGLVPIELCRMIHVRESLKIVSYEGVRLITRAGGDQAAVDSRANQIFSDRNIKDASITYHVNDDDPTSVPSATPPAMVTNDSVKVIVTAEYQDNSVFGVWFTDMDITCATTMLRE